jgi:hypothetical protein
MSPRVGFLAFVCLTFFIVTQTDKFASNDELEDFDSADDDYAFDFKGVRQGGEDPDEGPYEPTNYGMAVEKAFNALGLAKKAESSVGDVKAAFLRKVTEAEKSSKDPKARQPTDSAPMDEEEAFMNPEPVGELYESLEVVLLGEKHYAMYGEIVRKMSLTTETVPAGRIDPYVLFDVKKGEESTMDFMKIMSTRRDRFHALVTALLKALDKSSSSADRAGTATSP